LTLEPKSAKAAHRAWEVFQWLFKKNRWPPCQLPKTRTSSKSSTLILDGINTQLLLLLQLESH
jgi:hypothetical protein